MRRTQPLSITFPLKMAGAVKAKGYLANMLPKAGLIRDGVRVLPARGRVVEKWMPEQVAPAYDAIKAKPTRA